MNFSEIKFKNRLDFVQKTGNKVLVDIQKIILEKGKVNIAISGGNTPIDIFKFWLNSSFNQWDKVSFFWVDERFVPYNDIKNNASNALKILNELNVEGFYRMETNLGSAEKSAESYEQCLTKQLPIVENLPYFDLILLGIGTDGHTASLFPYTSILEETQKSVASVYVEKLDSFRISLTYPTILNAGKRYVFLGIGKEKAFEKAKLADSSHTKYPIKKIMTQGKAHDEYLSY
jgi:6-phosphogluconolactonase